MELQPISMRLPDSGISDLEDIAKKQSIPLRTMLRMWIMARLAVEQGDT